MSTLSSASTGVNESSTIASLRALVQSSQFISEEDEMDESPSPVLGGKASHDLKWLKRASIILQGWTRGQRKWLGLDSAALLLNKNLPMKRSGNGCLCPPCMTALWYVQPTAP